jgi:lipopolysaccharide transport system ATP-binding protein
MTQPAIQVSGLCKRYRLGALASLDRSFRELICDTAARLLGRGRPDDEPDHVFHALRDVSFTVEPGEVVGIIGRNGAGKSTLLKVLSRITDPSDGEVRIRGRVASLLEVGSGFHPELTGRENIFLNAAVLGMTYGEVKRKFDEIVAFAGVERFLDTPVKRYSSGMYVRLAFAVAAHLEPEILIVDEVLAVGDAEFQRKCLGKMQDVARNSGRTVLFVSHNMAAVQNLCGRSIWLEAGQLRQVDATDRVIRSYLRASRSHADGSTASWVRAPGMQQVIRSVRLLDEDGRPGGSAPAGGQVTVEVAYDADEELVAPCFGIGIDTGEGQRLMLLQTRLQHGPIGRLPARGVVRCHVPRLPLTTGDYLISVGCSVGRKQLDQVEHAATLSVDVWDAYGTGELPQPQQGRVLVDAEWEFDAAGMASLSPMSGKAG